MQPLLVLTIGQAPRHDMVAELADVMGDRAETAIATATEIATDRVMMAGADAATIEVIEVEDLPLAYLPGDARRVRVRVVADLAG